MPPQQQALFVGSHYCDIAIKDILRFPLEKWEPLAY